MLVFWLWFYAVELGPGALAAADSFGPTFTVGAVVAGACVCATASVTTPTPTSNPPSKIDFFMSILLSPGWTLSPAHPDSRHPPLSSHQLHFSSFLRVALAPHCGASVLGLAVADL